MSRLPVISGRECVKALAQAGFATLRQRGSHVILERNEPFCLVVIPDHKEIDRGTLRSIIRQAGLAIDEFVKLLP